MTRKVVRVEGVTLQVNSTFIEKLFEAFEEGYRPAPKGKGTLQDLPMLVGGVRQVGLYSKDHDFSAKPDPKDFYVEPKGIACVEPEQSPVDVAEKVIEEKAEVVQEQAVEEVEVESAKTTKTAKTAKKSTKK